MSLDKTPDKEFEDVLMAMDVVDTLRQNTRVVERELTVANYDQDLIARLKGIYSSQGIDVPDYILKEGVKALKEDRFRYEALAPSSARSMAELYIKHQNLVPFLLLGGLGVLGFVLVSMALKIVSSLGVF